MTPQCVPVGARKLPRKRIRSLIQGYLWEWGEWRDAANCHGLSYPPFSVEGRMIESGGYSPSLYCSKIPRYFPNHRILKLDNEIRRLPEKDKELLMYRYIAGATFDDVAHYISQTIHQVRYHLDRVENTLHLPR